jgi:hypothetical protein
MRKLFLTLAALGALAVAAPATAQNGATLFGGAVQENGHVRMTSVATQGAGVEFPTGGNITTFSSLRHLSARFNVTDDACAGGSPRYSISFGAQTLHIYLGTLNTTTGQFECTANTWLQTGNLIGDSTARFDLTQFGGPFYGTYQQAVALLGSREITGIRFVTDAGWAFADGEQTVLACNFRINNRTFFRCGARNGGQNGMNASQMCRQQRESMGDAAFRAMWGRNTNMRNAFGKCVSTMAKARQNGESAELQSDILAATTACRAQGHTGTALGNCVRNATRDDIADASRRDRPNNNGNRGRGRP